MAEKAEKIKVTEIKGDYFHGDKLRVKHAAQYFGISKSWFDKAIMNREIPFYKLGNKAVYISIKEIEAMIEEGKVEAR